MLFYIIFLISIILFGSFTIGPLSIRVYFSIIMLILLIFQYKNNTFTPKNTYIFNYIVFIILMGIAMMMNGEFESFDFVRYVLAYFLVSIIVFYATGHFITCEKKINITINALIAIVFITSIVTILQFIGNPFAWTIATILGSVDEEWVDVAVSHNEEFGSLIGSSFASGILGRSFLNAIFISSFGLLSYKYIYDRTKKWYYRIFASLIAVISLIACFMTQQRGAFYIMIVFIVFITFINSKKKILSFIMIFAICLLGYYVSYVYLDNTIMGRLSVDNLSTENDSRGELWENARLFIGENLLWGGALRYEEYNDGMPAHNFFYNAFIYSGLFGAIAVIILFIRILLLNIKTILNKNSYNTWSFYLALSMLSYLAQGLLHNASLVTGDHNIMLLLALLLVDKRMIVYNVR